MRREGGTDSGVTDMRREGGTDSDVTDMRREGGTDSGVTAMRGEGGTMLRTEAKGRLHRWPASKVKISP